MEKMFAIFGNPVAHSKSPLMHNRFFKTFQIGGCYGRYLLKRGEELIQKFWELGLEGANVTVPFKEVAAQQVDRLEGLGREIGAVNTLVRQGRWVIGYNTDGPGFLEAVKGFQFQRALILGGGGTARAVAVALARDGVEVAVLNRSPGRLQFFREKGIPSYSWEEFKLDREYQLVVNTTSAGLTDNSLPAPEKLLEEILEGARYGVDAIYGKVTPFLKLAHRKGLETQDGREMLVYQGVLAMELFLDQFLPREEVAQLYREVLG